MVSKPSQFRVGDRVLVPWGLDDVLGEIVEVYVTGLGPRVRVRMVDDPDGPTITLPLDSVTAEGTREEVDRAAAFADSREYEERIEAALDRCIQILNVRHPRLKVRRNHNPRPDSPTDFELLFGKRRLLVEAKHYAAHQGVSTDTILTYAGLAEFSTGVLLVANVRLTSPAAQRLEQLWAHGRHLRFALWRSDSDDGQLRKALDMFRLVWKLD